MTEEQHENQRPESNGTHAAAGNPAITGEAAEAPEATLDAGGADPEPMDGEVLEAAEAEDIETLRRERDEYLDQWRRTTAEFQNFKKREERLRRERERAANAFLLRDLLPVLDDLGRGAAHVPEQLTDDDWVSGMLAIERKLMSILERHGVTTIESGPNEPFDPHVHEAITTQESTEVEQDHILQELERGYRHHDTVLRPARVIVAK